MQLTFILTTLGLFGTFIVFFTIIYLLSERKKILVSMWLIGSGLFLLATTITIGLMFLTNADITIVVSAFVWGSIAGGICGNLNFKYKYKKIHRLKGSI